jgi:uncharacterized protein YhhL (DUF1145 family)
MRWKESSDRVVLSSGGSVRVVLMFLGAPVLLLGVLAIIAALDSLDDPAKADAVPRVLIVGAVLSLVGLLMLGGRSSVVIDQRTREVVKWWGLFVPFRRKVHPIASFIRVTVGIRQGQNQSQKVFSVSLSGESTLEIEAPSRYQNARTTAERLARLLQLPLADASSGTEVTREWQYLDEPLRERIRRTREELPDVEAPPTMRCKVHQEMGAVRIEAPPPGMPIAGFFGGLILLFFGGIFLFNLTQPFRRDFDIDPAFLVALGIGVLSTIAVLLLRARGAAARSLITASPAMLKLERRVLFFRQTIEIPGDKLEELVLVESQPQWQQMLGDDSLDATKKEQLSQLGPVMNTLLQMIMGVAANHAIVARSDAANIELLKGLDIKELRYLHAVLTRVMVA